MSDFWIVALGSGSFCRCCGRCAVHFNFLHLGQRTGEVQLIFSLIFSFPFLLKKPQQQLCLNWELESSFSTSHCRSVCAHSLLQGMQVLQPRPRLTAGLQQVQAGAERRAFCFAGAEILWLSMSSSSPGLDFWDNYLNFDCITHMKMQVFGSWSVVVISGAGSRNTAKGKLNTWYVCLCLCLWGMWCDGWWLWLFKGLEQFQW